jgi:hypothetical protein
MGVQFRSTFYGTQTNVAYRVDILNSDYSGAIKNFELGSDGFKLRYFQESDEIYQPIKPSQLTLPIKITQDANGTAMFNFLQDTLIQGNENKYTIEVFKSGSLWWCGVILPDIAKHDDSSISYDWTITASDGLNRLKNFDFNVEFADPLEEHSVTSIKNIIHECLKNTPLYFSTSYTNLFSTCIEWYEANMPARTDETDPFAQSYLDTWAFTKIEKNERVRISQYEVLEQICLGFGARLIFSNGIYRFLQIGAYEQVTPSYERFYNTTGVFVDAVMFTDEVFVNNTPTSLPKVISGNIFSYFPPLKNVSIKFPFTNSNMLNAASTMPYTQPLPNDIIGGVNNRLVFSTELSINITDTAFNPAHGAVITVRIYLQLGTSYILLKDIFSNTNSWSSTLTDFAEFYKESKSTLVNFPINFYTDAIPSGDYSNSSFEIEVYEVLDFNTGDPLDHVAVRLNGTTTLKFITNLDNGDESFTYKVQNTATTINSYDIELPDATFGEMYDESYYGGIKTGDDMSASPSTGQWRIKDAGTAYNLILLRLREVMSNQVKATQKYQGGIVGSSSINPHTLVTYDGDSYILNGGEYTAQSEMWDAEWFMVDYNRVNIEDIGDEVEEPGGDTNEQLRRSIGDVGVQLDGVTFKGGTKKTTVIDTNTTLQPISQNIIATDGPNITLPAAADWTAFDDGNSIEITVLNAATMGDNIHIKYSDGSAFETLAHTKFVRLVSDGTNIYKIG